jgi:methylenetetrahydrofolate reductase (NADPH)
MPITNYRQLSRFSEMCGAEIPQWLRRRLEGYGEDGASIRAFGLDVVTELCERLLAGGAPGLHIYTLNRANASFLLWQRLNGIQP